MATSKLLAEWNEHVTKVMKGAKVSCYTCEHGLHDPRGFRVFCRLFLQSPPAEFAEGKGEKCEAWESDELPF